MGVGDQCHVLAALSLGNKPGTLCTAGLMGATTSLDSCGKSCSHQVQFLDLPILATSAEICYKSFVKKPGGKRSIGRHRNRCKNNIKLHITDTRCEAVKWITLLRIVYV
jgi:hypothetical protein